MVVAMRRDCLQAEAQMRQTDDVSATNHEGTEFPSKRSERKKESGKSRLFLHFYELGLSIAEDRIVSKAAVL